MSLRCGGARACRLGLALALLFLVTGCWDHRELNELALVMAVGVDLRPETGRYRITAQIARPMAAAGRQGSGGDQGAVYIATSEGRSLFEAIRNLTLFSSRRVMWAHNKIIVLGEELARQDISEVVDFFTRNPELRLRTLIGVTEGEAMDVVGITTGLEQIPADSIEKLFRYSQFTGESIHMDIKGLAADFLDPAVHPALSRLQLREHLVQTPANRAGEPRQVELHGTAVFRHNRLAGWMNDSESRGLLWLRRKPARAVMTLPCPDESARSIVLEVKNGNIRVWPYARQGQPAFTVEIEATATLSELGCPLPIGLPKVKAGLEDALAKAIRADVRGALHKLQQEYRVDAAGLGKHLRAKQPGLWSQIGERWDQVFPQARVDVSVRAHVTSPVLSIRPTHPPKEEPHP